MTDQSSARRWYIEVGPVQPPPGPGDGTDAAFETKHFFGTKEEAEREGQRLSKAWEDRFRSDKGTDEYPCYDSDIGRFAVGAAVRESPEHE